MLDGAQASATEKAHVWSVPRTWRESKARKIGERQVQDDEKARFGDLKHRNCHAKVMIVILPDEQEPLCMASKAAIDRQRAARTVASTAYTYSADTASRVKETLLRYAKPGEQIPDIQLLLRLVGRMIASENEALTRADAAHEIELADDTEPRKQRDETAEKVRRNLKDLRTAIETTYGAVGLPRLQLSDTIPHDPSALAMLARTVLVHLRDESIKLPAARRRGLSLDREAFAEELASDLPLLDKALAVVAREAREAEVTLRAKRLALESNDRAFTRGAAFLSATFTLAGLDELAEKIRPSIEQTGQTHEGTLAATNEEVDTDAP
jgi:hypothetical protein